MLVFVLLILYLLASAYFDIKWQKVKNTWILYGIASGMIFSIFDSGICGDGGCRLGLGFQGFESSLQGMLLPFLLIVFYYLRLIGAGDIKLLMVCGSFLGTSSLKDLFIPIVFFAGIYSLVYVIKSGEKIFAKKHFIPLAPAILSGVVFNLIIKIIKEA